MINGHRIVLHFDTDITDQPIIQTLITKYNLTCNIIRAAIAPNQEGYVALEITGEDQDYKNAIDYLVSIKTRIDDFKQKIIRYEEKCTQCGGCSGFCPTGALSIDHETQIISFDNNKCVACGLCIKACPYKAMQNNF